MEMIETYRARKKQQFQLFLNNLPTTDEQVVTIVTSIAPVRIKLHYPDVEKASYPVVFNFHGGGFVLGMYEQDDAYCRMLSRQSQSLVINVDYPLAPEHPFPEPTLAIAEVVQNVLDNAQKYRVNKHQVFLCGSSAGGNLALSCQEYFHQQDQDGFAGVICYYAVFDLEGWFKQSRYYPWYITKPEDAHSPLASPIQAVRKDQPPIFLHLAQLDPLYSEGMLYAQTLKKQGIEIKISIHSQVDHGFLHEMYKEYDAKAARKAIEQTASFIRQYRS